MTKPVFRVGGKEYSGVQIECAADVLALMWTVGVISAIRWLWPIVGPHLFTPCPIPSGWTELIIGAVCLLKTRLAIIDHCVDETLKAKRAVTADALASMLGKQP